ncbi:DUF2273 domain-containing protein [Leuconostoc citreum]
MFNKLPKSSYFALIGFILSTLTVTVGFLNCVLIVFVTIIFYFWGLWADKYNINFSNLRQIVKKK